MCNRMQRFHNLSVIGMILIIAYRMGNRQVITKVPAGMLRGLPQIYIVASLKTQ